MAVAKPIFNIITRTSNRPLYFEKCQESIQSQTYPIDSIKKFVTFDNESDLDSYIQKYNNLVILEMESQKRKNQNHFPYHAYLNEAIEQIVEDGSGWIIILDDDNTLAKKDSLEIIAKNISDGGNDLNKFYLWKCQQSDKIVPSDLSFGRSSPKSGDVHISCFAFHSSHADIVKFETKRGAEADVIATLYEKLKCVWIDDILTIAPVAGNGTRRDLQVVQDSKKKITLKPVASPVTVPENKESSKIKIAPKAQLPPPKNEPKVSPKKIPDLVIVKEDDVDDDDDADVVDDDADDDGNDDVVEKDDDDDEEEEIRDQIDENNSDEEEIVGTDEPEKEVTTTVNDIEKMAPCETERKSDNKEKNLTMDKDKLKLFDQFMEVMGSGQKVYILNENNMKMLSKCLCEAVACVELEDKLVQVLEGQLLYCKNNELKGKINRMKCDTNDCQPVPVVHTPSQQLPLVQQLPPSITKPMVESLYGGDFVDRIYMITQDTSNRNASLERNKKILTLLKIEYEVVGIKEMTTFIYQNQIKEILINAKKNNYRKIMILNGNDLLNTKFVGLFEKQIGKITGDCSLWFLGNAKETPAKDIVNTKFELEDYLYMYDDIVTAKLSTVEKAKNHWKTYGHREARYGAIDVVNTLQQPVNCNHGFIIASDLYDIAIELLDKQSVRDCKNFLVDLQKSHVDGKRVWLSRPDLIIPGFANSTATAKNKQIALKNGWYFNFYK